jgi:hypothetical protein
MDHLDLVESSGGERKQLATDPVALRLRVLADVAQRQKRLCQMESGRIVQADKPAEVGKADTVAVPRHGLDDREGAAQRLHTRALRIGVEGALDLRVRAACVLFFAGHAPGREFLRLLAQGLVSVWSKTGIRGTPTFGTSMP